MKTTLLIMAAGIGSRFGTGIKQLEPVDASNHMLLSIAPKLSVSSFMGYLKGKSSLMMFDRHGNLKYKFGNRHFWSDGYYVSTVGLNDATIKKYIRDQERADILKDKMSVREYEDPFGAQPGKDPKINR